MIALRSATETAEDFFHVFMEVSLSLSLLPLFFTSSFAFGKMFLNRDIK